MNPNFMNIPPESGNRLNPTQHSSHTYVIQNSRPLLVPVVSDTQVLLRSPPAAISTGTIAPSERLPSLPLPQSHGEQSQVSTFQFPVAGQPAISVRTARSQAAKARPRILQRVTHHRPAVPTNQVSTASQPLLLGQERDVMIRSVYSLADPPGPSAQQQNARVCTGPNVPAGHELVPRTNSMASKPSSTQIKNALGSRPQQVSGVRSKDVTNKEPSLIIGAVYSLAGNEELATGQEAGASISLHAAGSSVQQQTRTNSDTQPSAPMQRNVNLPSIQPQLTVSTVASSANQIHTDIASTNLVIPGSLVQAGNVLMSTANTVASMAVTCATVISSSQTMLTPSAAPLISTALPATTTSVSRNNRQPATDVVLPVSSASVISAKRQLDEVQPLTGTSMEATIQGSKRTLSVLSDDNQLTTVSGNASKEKEPEIVDVEEEDLEDCMLVKIDLSKRFLPFGRKLHNLELVIDDDSDDECSAVSEAQENQGKSDGKKETESDIVSSIPQKYGEASSSVNAHEEGNSATKVGNKEATDLEATALREKDKDKENTDAKEIVINDGSDTQEAKEEKDADSPDMLLNMEVEEIKNEEPEDESGVFEEADRSADDMEVNSNTEDLPESSSTFCAQASLNQPSVVSCGGVPNNGDVQIAIDRFTDVLQQCVTTSCGVNGRKETAGQKQQTGTDSGILPSVPMQENLDLSSNLLQVMVSTAAASANQIHTDITSVTHASLVVLGDGTKGSVEPGTEDQINSNPMNSLTSADETQRVSTIVSETTSCKGVHTTLPDSKAREEVKPRTSTLSCKLCSQTFLSRTELVTHTLVSHKPAPPSRGGERDKYLCSICRKPFHNSTHLKLHEKLECNPQSQQAFPIGVPGPDQVNSSTSSFSDKDPPAFDSINTVPASKDLGSSATIKKEPLIQETTAAAMGVQPKYPQSQLADHSESVSGTHEHEHNREVNTNAVHASTTSQITDACENTKRCPHCHQIFPDAEKMMEHLKFSPACRSRTQRRSEKNGSSSRQGISDTVNPEKVPSARREILDPHSQEKVSSDRREAANTHNQKKTNLIISCVCAQYFDESSKLIEHLRHSPACSKYFPGGFHSRGQQTQTDVEFTEILERYCFNCYRIFPNCSHKDNHLRMSRACRIYDDFYKRKGTYNESRAGNSNATTSGDARTCAPRQLDPALDHGDGSHFVGGSSPFTVRCESCSIWLPSYASLKKHFDARPKCKEHDARLYPKPGEGEEKTQQTTPAAGKPKISCPACKRRFATNAVLTLHLNDSVFCRTKILQPSKAAKRKFELKKKTTSQPRSQVTSKDNAQSKDNSNASESRLECNAMLNSYSASSVATHAKKMVQCKVCKKEFGTHEELQLHVTDLGSCKIGPLKPVSLRVVLKPVSVMCRACHAAFTDDFQLAKHLQSSHSCLEKNDEDAKGKYKCSGCRKKFTDDETLARHLQRSSLCLTVSDQNEDSSISSDQLTEKISRISRGQPSEPSSEKQNNVIKHPGGSDKETTSSAKIQQISPSSEEGSPLKESEISDETFSSNDDSDSGESFSSSEETDIEYRCKVCNITFTHRSHMKRHMKTHHHSPQGTRKLRCQACTRKFKDNTSLQAHLLQQRFCFLPVTRLYWQKKGGPQTCSMCRKVLPTPKDLRKHCFKVMACRLRYVDLILKNLKTKRDGEESSSTLSSGSDTLNKIATDEIPCTGEVSSSVLDSECSTVKQGYASPDQHAEMQSETSTETVNSTVEEKHEMSQRKKCAKCGMQVYHVVSHIYKHQACLDYYGIPENGLKDQVPFCFKCKRRFFSVELFKDHKCPGFQPYTHICLSCGQKFAHEHSMKIHHGKSLACGKLGRRISEPENFDMCDGHDAPLQDKTTHEKRRSAEQQDENITSTQGDREDSPPPLQPSVPSFSCLICQEKFPMLRLLMEHSYKHEEENPYKCDRCGLTFYRYNTLVSHQAFHIRMDKEKGWPTAERKSSDTKLESGKPENRTEELCGEKVKDDKGTTQDANNQHICLVCHQSFDQYENFRAHVLTHSRSSYHSCTICFQNFTSKEALERHNNQHEKSKTRPKQEAARPKSQAKHLFLRISKPDNYEVSENSYECLACSKSFSSEKEKKEHIAISGCCQNVMAQIISQNSDLSVEESESHSDYSESVKSRAGSLSTKLQSVETPCQSDCDQSPSDKMFDCLFCHQRYLKIEEKISHISKSPACRGIMNYILDNKYYILSQDDKEACQKRVADPTRCEFCQQKISDKTSHLLTTGCLYSLEEAILKYRANPGLSEELKGDSCQNVGESRDEDASSALSLSERTCNICNKTFGKPSSLKVHVTKVHGHSLKNTQMQRKTCSSNMPSNKDVYCFSCKKYLKTEAEIKQHRTLPNHQQLSRSTIKKAAWKHGYYRCKICERSYDTKLPLLMHMRNCHEKENEAPVETHEAKDLQQGQAKCTLCKLFVFKQGRRSHFDAHLKRLVKSVREKSNKPLVAISREPCAICKKVFLSRRKLIHHLLRHVAADIYGKEKNPLIGKCRICNNPVRSRSAFQTHISNFHHKKITVTLMYQRYFISSETPITKNHMVSKKSNQNNNEKSDNEDSLDAGPSKKPHVPITAGKQGSVPGQKTARRNSIGFCKLCNKSFTNIWSYRFHLKIIHKKKDPEKYLTFFKSTEPKSSGDSGDADCLYQRAYATFSEQKIMAGGGGTSAGEDVSCVESPSTHSDVPDSELGRPECRAGFSLKQTKSAMFYCHVCQMTVTVSGYKGHLLNDHHWRPERLYACTFCQLPFPFSKLLRDHMTQCEKDCRCDFCGKQMQSVKSIRKHLTRTHKADWLKYTRSKLSAQVIEVDNGGQRISSSCPSKESGPDENVSHICLLCRESFLGVSCYQTHLRTHLKPCKVVVQDKNYGHNEAVDDPLVKIEVAEESDWSYLKDLKASQSASEMMQSEPARLAEISHIAQKYSQKSVVSDSRDEASGATGSTCNTVDTETESPVKQPTLTPNDMVVSSAVVSVSGCTGTVGVATQETTSKVQLEAASTSKSTRAMTFTVVDSSSQSSASDCEYDQTSAKSEHSDDADSVVNEALPVTQSLVNCVKTEHRFTPKLQVKDAISRERAISKSQTEEADISSVNESNFLSEMDTVSDAETDMSELQDETNSSVGHAVAINSDDDGSVSEIRAKCGAPNVLKRKEPESNEDEQDLKFKRQRISSPASSSRASEVEHGEKQQTSERVAKDVIPKIEPVEIDDDCEITGRNLFSTFNQNMNDFGDDDDISFISFEKPGTICDKDQPDSSGISVRQTIKEHTRSVSDTFFMQSCSEPCPEIGPKPATTDGVCKQSGAMSSSGMRTRMVTISSPSQSSAKGPHARNVFDLMGSADSKNKAASQQEDF